MWINSQQQKKILFSANWTIAKLEMCPCRNKTALEMLTVHALAIDSMQPSMVILNVYITYLILVSLWIMLNWIAVISPQNNILVSRHNIKCSQTLIAHKRRQACEQTALRLCSGWHNIREYKDCQTHSHLPIFLYKLFDCDKYNERTFLLCKFSD